jgi:hypothetical protein
MSDWPGLDLLLHTDPRDGGCAEAMKLLHVYVDRLLAGDNVEDLFSSVAAHLAACDPCDDDFQGLLGAATEKP